jgi:hypothetical protein
MVADHLSSTRGFWISQVPVHATSGDFLRGPHGPSGIADDCTPLTFHPFGVSAFACSSADLKAFFLHCSIAEFWSRFAPSNFTPAQRKFNSSLKRLYVPPVSIFGFRRIPLEFMSLCIVTMHVIGRLRDDEL